MATPQIFFPLPPLIPVNIYNESGEAGAKAALLNRLVKLFKKNSDACALHSGFLVSSVWGEAQTFCVMELHRN